MSTNVESLEKIHAREIYANHLMDLSELSNESKFGNTGYQSNLDIFGVEVISGTYGGVGGGLPRNLEMGTS